MQNSIRAALLSCVGLCFTGATFAADLVITTPPVTTPAPAAANWDGVYLGALVGYGAAFADHTSQTPGNDLNLSGALAGIRGGVNTHLSSQIIGGLDLDLAWANITGTDPALFGPPTHTINWLGSVRGRLGYDAGELMPYLTGGVAFGGATRESGFGPQPNTATATHIGWTVGAGLEIAATDQLSIDLQYRYTDLGSRVYDWSGLGANPTVHLTANTITAGLNWHF